MAARRKLPQTITFRLSTRLAAQIDAIRKRGTGLAGQPSTSETLRVVIGRGVADILRELAQQESATS